MANYKNQIVSSSTFTLLPGDTATSTHIRNMGEVRISGATTFRSYVSSGGVLKLFSGDANDTIVYSGGVVLNSGGGTFFGVRVHTGGSVLGFLYTGAGSAHITNITSGVIRGEFASATVTTDMNGIVGAEGRLSHITMEYRGHLIVSSGGIASTCFVTSGGALTVSAHGSAYDVYVSNGGGVTVKSGYISGTTVYSGGVVSNGGSGVLLATTVYKGGRVVGFTYQGDTPLAVSEIRNDEVQCAISSATVELDAVARIGKNGSIAFATVNSRGAMYISGKATDVAVQGGGALYVFGGSASGTSVFSGGSLVAHRGFAENTTVYSGGIMSDFGVDSVIKDATILSGGRLIVDSTCFSGAIRLGGSMNIGTEVDASAAKIYMDISSRSTTDGVIINDIGKIFGGELCITVLATGQSSGIYMLADGAGIFTDTVSVYNTANTLLGTLSSMENSFTINGYVYTLLNLVGGLSISVEASIDWPVRWLEAPATAKAVTGDGVIGAAYQVGGVYAARTEAGESYENIRFDYQATTNAAFYARLIGGSIGTFYGGDYENYLYMTGGSVTALYGAAGTGADNDIVISGGSIDTLYGGGVSGAQRVKIEALDGTFTNLYGGGAGGYTDQIDISVSRGTYNRIRCGAAAGGSAGSIRAKITGGNITGQITGGGLGDAANVELTISVTTTAYIYGGSVGGNISGDVSLRILGGGYQGLLIAGSRASGSGASVTVDGTINFTMTDGAVHSSNPKAVAAGVDTAWIFAGQAMQGSRFNGGNSNMSVSGGSVVKYLVGGAMADGAGSVAVVANVSVTVNNATITGGIWGAGYSFNGGNASAGVVAITIAADGGNTVISGNIRTGGIVLSGGGSVNYSSGLVTFTGSGDYLDFSKTVDGSGAATSSTLLFNDFTGSFNATIVGFKRVAFSGDASVDIRNTYSGCKEIVFDLVGRESENAFINSQDSLAFANGGGNYIGIVVDALAMGEEAFFELMTVSDIGSLDGVKVGLLSDSGATDFYAVFDIGEVYNSTGFELVVDYDFGGKMLYAFYSPVG